MVPETTIGTGRTTCSSTTSESESESSLRSGLTASKRNSACTVDGAAGAAGARRLKTDATNDPTRPTNPGRTDFDGVAENGFESTGIAVSDRSVACAEVSVSNIARLNREYLRAVVVSEEGA